MRFPRILQARAPVAHAANWLDPSEVFHVPSLRKSRAEFLRAQIATALRTYPTAKAAADALGISAPTLNYYMRRYGVRVETTRHVAT